MSGFAAAFAALPEGTFRAVAEGRRFLVTKRAVAGGRGWKLTAEELGGPGRIGANVYRLADGLRVFPCEMPMRRVRAFVEAAQAEGDPGPGRAR